MQLKIIKGDITTIECDAIVSSTNSSLSPSGELDSAIHAAAGSKLTEACSKLALVPIGNCVVTDGYNLPCKYVIHTVAPHANAHYATRCLVNCYKNAIAQAKMLKCASVAFPLIGSGGKGFSIEKSIYLALNCIDACMHDDEYNLLIYVVVHHNEIFELAMSQAKRIIKAGYLITDSAPTNEVASSVETNTDTDANHWISLCRVNKPDKNKLVWMRRIADLIDGVLIAHVPDKEQEAVFGNRLMVFRNNGPKKTDSIGFWEWKEVPKDNGSEGWKSVSSFIEDISPIEIIECNEAQSVEELVNLLKDGIDIPSYTHDQVLFVVNVEGGTFGILCALENFAVRNIPYTNNVRITLENTVHVLPCYEISKEDVISWDNRKVYSKIALPDPIKKIFVHIPIDAIRQIILERFMNWPVFKAKGISKSDWQKFKEFFGTLPLETIYEELSTTYGMDTSDVQECVSEFLRNVETHIDRSDIDSSLFIQMIENHEGFKEICSQSAYEIWKKEHQQDLDSAQAEIEQIKTQIEEERAAASMQLLALNDEMLALEAQKTSLLNDITNADVRFTELQQMIRQQEVLGEQTVEAVRRKIADAQKDMAGFIADLSVFLPQNNAAPAAEKNSSSWQYKHAPYAQHSEDDVDIAESWRDELNSLNQNFAQSLGMSAEFSAMLSAFVYAAHINNMPLLIAGPGSDDIAEILSVSLYGNGAGQLTLGNECDCDVADAIKDCEEPVISVRNMFGKGWSDNLLQAFRKLKKQIVWTHPYVEDMAIEPKGLYNYMLPVFSECFVGTLANIDPWPGKRAEEFEPFVSQKRTRLRMSAFGRLKLSRLLLAQLEKVLSDARELMNNSNADKDIEILFGLIPLCVLTGKTDILREAIETETGISSAVKVEAARYFEEE